MGFTWDAHAGFLRRSLLSPGLPRQYVITDTQRTTLAYFCVTGLDILGRLETCSETDRAAVIAWVLGQQVTAGEWRQRGFRGGSFGVTGDPPRTMSEGEMDEGNLPATYSSLATLVALEVDLATDVDSDGIVRAMGSLQQEDGSFRASTSDSTCDLRFTYCACAVSTILGDWSGVDRRKAIEYIERCYDFDGGIGLAPGREACAGPTYCAVASLQLLGALDTLPTSRRRGLVEWCVKRQVAGFQGRPNKAEDSCCSFWVGATLALLDGLHLVNTSRAQLFLTSCQYRFHGGFAKAPGMPPDLMHSFYSLSWLSLAGEDASLEDLDVALGLTRRAAEKLGICSTAAPNATENRRSI